MKIACFGFVDYERKRMLQYLCDSGYPVEFYEDMEALLSAMESDDIFLLILNAENHLEVKILQFFERMQHGLLPKRASVLCVSTQNNASKYLDCGADGFLAYPFGKMEFSARIRAILRRREILLQP